MNLALPFGRRSPAGKLLATITIILVALTTGKMLYIAFSPKLIAFSNTFDFVRTSACIGLWQDYGPGDKLRGHMESPVNRLVYDGDKMLPICTRSIDNLFPWLAVQFHHIGDVVDFREIAMARVVFVLVALIASLVLARAWWQRLVIAGLYSLIFGDLGYLLFFNTMYSEFSVVLGLFVLLVLLFLFCVQSHRPTWQQLAFALLGMLFFGMGKQSYGLFSVVLAGGLGIAIAARWRGLRSVATAATLVACALALPVSFVALTPNSYAMNGAARNANMTDSFLGEILPNATNKEAALDTLGLPRTCMKGIGMNWYSPEVAKEYPCPPLIYLSRARLLPLLISQPMIFVRMMDDAIEHARPFPHPGYHWFEDPADEHALGFRIVKYTSLTTLYSALPDGVFRVLALLSMFSTAVCAVIVIAQRRGSWAVALFLIGGLLFFYSLGSAIFGDGKVDVPKHSCMWAAALGVQILCAIVITVRCAMISRTMSGTTSAQEMPSEQDLPLCD